MHNKKLRVVIGGEEGFYGLDCIKRNYRGRVDPDFHFYKTMTETAAAAIKIAKSV